MKVATMCNGKTGVMGGDGQRRTLGRALTALTAACQKLQTTVDTALRARRQSEEVARVEEIERALPHDCVALLNTKTDKVAVFALPVSNHGQPFDKLGRVAPGEKEHDRATVRHVSELMRLKGGLEALLRITRDRHSSPSARDTARQRANAVEGQIRELLREPNHGYE